MLSEGYFWALSFINLKIKSLNNKNYENMSQLRNEK